MLIPVRCFSCGQVVGDKFTKYTDLLNTGYNEKECMNALGLSRYCCRRMLLTYVDFSEMMLRFNAADNAVPAQGGVGAMNLEA